MNSGETDPSAGKHQEPADARNYADNFADNQEAKNLRRLQVMMEFLLAHIRQDNSITVEDAAALVARTRDAAMRMFPGREQAFHLLCRPKIQRAMRERFHIQ